MKFCEICGNEIEINSKTCPYCGRSQKGTGKVITKTDKIQKINIKSGMPTANEAIRIAKEKMMIARRNHVAVVKLVHGYGSTGKGGKIRLELREELNKMKSIGIIKDVIPGENFTPNSCKQLLRRFPDLKEDEDLNRNNKGITLVEL